MYVCVLRVCVLCMYVCMYVCVCVCVCVCVHTYIPATLHLKRSPVLVRKCLLLVCIRMSMRFRTYVHTFAGLFCLYIFVGLFCLYRSRTYVHTFVGLFCLYIFVSFFCLYIFVGLFCLYRSGTYGHTCTLSTCEHVPTLLHTCKFTTHASLQHMHACALHACAKKKKSDRDPSGG